MSAERRLRSCVARWPACATGEYNPACCRFPKSCSATVYDRDVVTDADLEAAGTSTTGRVHPSVELTHESRPTGSAQSLDLSVRVSNAVPLAGQVEMGVNLPPLTDMPGVRAPELRGHRGPVVAPEIDLVVDAVGGSLEECHESSLTGDTDAKRRCTVVGCGAFPDAAWSLCAEHLTQIEADIDADYAAQEPSDQRMAEPARMRSPYRCKWCGHVHDGALVTVVQRYADCSTWKCPGCGVLIDDRPEGWGGSAIPVPRAPVRAPLRGVSIMYAEFDGIAVCILPDGRWCERELGHNGPHVLAQREKGEAL